MNLIVRDQELHIELTFWERFLAVESPKYWQIPLAHIEQVTTTKPSSSWRDLRWPGTAIGSVRTGTYLTDRGKEFWYKTRDTDYLQLELRDEPFKRIILTIDGNESWQQRLSQLITNQFLN